MLSTVGAAAIGEGSRSVFRANLPVVWECAKEVGVSCLMSQKTGLAWQTVKWD